MKHMVKFTALVCCSLAAAPLFAEITTGWIQTGAGPYDYNDTANWVGGDINGVFSSDLTLTAAQTITFDHDTTLPNGLTFNHAGAYKITMKSADANTYTLTLGGDIENSSEGSVEPEATLAFNLGEKTRTIACNGAMILIHGVISNGGIKFTGTSDLRLYGANTFEGGLDVFSTGYLYPRSVNSLGNGTVTFEGNNKVNGESSITLANNPIVLKGDIYYTGDKSLNMGAGAVTVTQPLTITVNKNTFTLGGPIAVDSPAKITDVTKAGGGNLSTSAGVEIDGADVIRTTSGLWYFNGAVSGTGPLIVRGNVEMKGSCSFDGDVRVESGSLRLCAKNVLPASAKVYIAKGATFRNYQSNGYGIATMINGGRIDPSSEGTFGIAENEEDQNIDLSNYPKLILAPNGDNRTVKGSITAPQAGVLRLGGGSKKLTLGGTIIGATEIDASTGSIQFNASQPNFDGTITCGQGYTLTVGSSVELANADLVSDGGTIRFASATAGEFTRARSVTLKTAQLTVDSPSAGATTHKITGTLLADVSNKTEGGIPRVTLTNSGANGLVLSAGSVSNALDAAMLHVVNSVTGEGTARFVIENTQTLGLVGNGAANSVNAPVAPFVRVDNSLATYTSEDGLRALNSSEYTVYEAGYEGPVLNAGENLATTGSGTVTLTGSATVNAIWMIGASGADQTLKASEGSTITVASGAIQINTYGSAKYELPTDFGTRRGFICARSATAYNLSGSLAGTGGLTIADGSTKLESNGVNLYSDPNTYTGDTWIFCRAVPKKGAFFPHAETLPNELKRLGDVYLYGKLYVNSVSPDLCGLNGVGDVEAAGSNSATLTVGYGDADGDHFGSVIGSTKTGAGGFNFGFAKVGSGRQRIAGTLGGKWNGNVTGGILQIDGLSTIGSRDSGYHIVFDGGTLSGSGTISDSVYCGDIQIKATGVIAPGSKENPNVPLKLCKNVEMTQGASMKFYIGEDRASQAIVAEGYGITGTATTIPVTVDCTVKKKGSWLLFEADTFNDKVFAFTTKPAGGRLVVKTVETSNRKQLWYEQTTGYSVTLR